MCFRRQEVQGTPLSDFQKRQIIALNGLVYGGKHPEQVKWNSSINSSFSFHVKCHCRMCSFANTSLIENPLYRHKFVQIALKSRPAQNTCEKGQRLYFDFEHHSIKLLCVFYKCLVHVVPGHFCRWHTSNYTQSCPTPHLAGRKNSPPMLL